MTSPRLQRLTALLPLLAVVLSLSTPLAKADSADCTPLLAKPTQGREAKVELKDKLREAAQRNGEDEESFSQRLDDETYWLDTCGMSFYVEPTSLQWDKKHDNNGKGKGGGNPIPSPLPPGIDLTKTFLLHSRPGANVTLYLDFTGHSISGTAWNATYSGGAAWNALGYSTDADYTTFSAGEMTNIWTIWYQVAEDYAALNIDVTTEVPASGVLERTDINDVTYGTRVLISDDPLISSACACGGISYVGVIDYPGTQHEYYQPAWVFSKALGYNNKYVAEAAAHEAGHSLGLSHDGTTTPSSAYYSGTNGWAPLMGVGYYQPLVQWSKGEYPNANNTQDDFAVMATHGATLVTDEDLNTSASARDIWVGSATSGIVSSALDSDWYRLVPSATGQFTLIITPSQVSPNLDVAANLYSSDGKTLIRSSNPAFTVLSSEVATGLGASFTETLTSGVTYYLSLSGSGFGALTSGGYSSYGSVGNYSIAVVGPVGPLALLQPSNQSLSLGVAYSLQLTATGGQPAYTWSASGLPAGLTISSTGKITGTPTTASNSIATVTVTDSKLDSRTVTFAMSVVSPLAITTKTLPVGENGYNYSAKIAATGGTSPYTWSATGLPLWATLDSVTGVISGLANKIANTSIVVTSKDSVGTKINQTLSLSIVAPVAITTTSVTAPTRLKAYKFTFAASGGTGTKTWSLASGSLPSGITLSPAGVLSGTTSVAKGSVYSFTVQIADLYSISKKSFTFTMN